MTDGMTPIVGLDQRIQQLSSKTMGTFDPDIDSVNQFCDSLLTLVEMYGEMSVIAAIPAALEGRARKWFTARGMPRDRMRSVDGWIEALTDEFRVNTAVAREKARLRRYNPSKDDSVDEYYYDKLELVRAAEANISRRRTVEELWMGLPADFQALLDYERMMEETVPNFGRILRTKDLSYRDMTNRRREERTSRTRFDNTSGFGNSGREERRDRKSSRRDRDRKREDKSTEESREKKDGKSSRDYKKKERKSEGRKEDLPPQLPRDKWRKDEKQ